MTEQRPDSKWHLDKRVPVTLLIAIVAQAAAMVWWGSKLDSRVDQLEQKSLKQDTMPERITKLETSLGFLSIQINSIDTKLDRLLVERRDNRDR